MQFDNSQHFFNFYHRLMRKIFSFYIILLLIIPFIFSSCSGSGQSASSEKANRELKALDKTLDNIKVYRGERRILIDSLRAKSRNLSDSLEIWKTLLELSSQYRLLNADSAVLTAGYAMEYAPASLSEEDRMHGKLTAIQAISTSGLFYAALTRLDSIDPDRLPLYLKIEYWNTTRMAYSYAASQAQGLDEYVTTLSRTQEAMSDSLLKYLPENDIMYRFLYCSDLVNSSDWQRAEIMLSRFLKEVPVSDNFHGMLAYQLAQAYKNQGDFDNYVTYLAIAAKSDIQANVKEGLALQELARWLYRQGDYERANRYISQSLDDAISGNVRMRTAAISNIASLIETTNRKELHRSHNAMTIYAVTSTVLFIVTAALALIFLRNSRKIRANEKKLSSSTKKLEAYVGNFIALCSNYSRRLDNLTRLVGRKIAAGQTEDLVKMINSGKISEQDSEGFYSLVDKALLDLYPDFVESINTLLAPDKQIELKPGELLTPELRIYVFIRLGITQSTKIAQILHYSVNTVYSYRNRMRNRAIDRDNFDEQVANLGTHENWIDNLPE